MFVNLLISRLSSYVSAFVADRSRSEAVDGIMSELFETVSFNRARVVFKMSFEVPRGERENRSSKV